MRAKYRQSQALTKIVYQDRDYSLCCSRALARSVLAVLIVLAPLAISPANGFELFGKRFFEPKVGATTLVENPQTYVAEIRFDGEPDRRFKKAIEGASTLVRQQSRPPSGTTGLLSRARGDLKRILAALYGQGHYGGTIGIDVDGRPLARLSAADRFGEAVPVIITVSPGPAFQFGTVQIENRPDFDQPETERIKTPEELGLVGGAPARSNVILAAESRLIEGWRQLGHPKAEIAGRDIVADHSSRSLDVTITVHPGPLSALGAVTVSGTERMNPAFVARHSGLEPGKRYDPDDIEDARDRFHRLEVFRSVTFAEADAVSDGFLPVDIIVRERKPRVFGAGVAYSTIDGVRVEAYWTHRNLFGQAERLRIEGSIGGLVSTQNDTPDYRLGATFTTPGVLTPDSDVRLAVVAFREETDNVVEETVKAGAAFSHRFSRTETGSVGVAIEQSEITDAFGVENYTILSLPVTLERDTRDNPTDPKKGYRAGITVEPFTDLASGTVAIGGTAHGSAYHSIDANGRVVIAGRVLAGSVFGADLMDIPSSRRFFAGGGGSVRGYGHETIGVAGPSGTTVGGRSVLEASAELRAQVTDTIGIVPFVDAGEVSASSGFAGLGDLRVGAGVGIRYHTALGPIRADVAVPLNPGPDDPDWALYVGIGQAF